MYNQGIAGRARNDVGAAFCRPHNARIQMTGGGWIADGKNAAPTFHLTVTKL